MMTPSRAIAPAEDLVTILNYKGIRPNAIYCIGRNYGEHAKELNNAVPEEPIVFLKSLTSLRRPEGGPLAFEAESFHHEAELVLLIDRYLPMGSHPTEEDVAAVTLGLDLTRREVQTKLKAKGLPWTTAKSFAGSAIIGDFLPRASVGSLSSVEFSFSVNGVLKQTGHTKDMIFSVPAVLAFLTTLGPLVAGDLIFTGTPAGVGPMRRGDDFVLEWTRLGKRIVGKL